MPSQITDQFLKIWESKQLGVSSSSNTEKVREKALGMAAVLANPDANSVLISQPPGPAIQTAIRFFVEEQAPEVLATALNGRNINVKAAVASALESLSPPLNKVQFLVVAPLLVSFLEHRDALVLDGEKRIILARTAASIKSTLRSGVGLLQNGPGNVDLVKRIQAVLSEGR